MRGSGFRPITDIWGSYLILAGEYPDAARCDLVEIFRVEDHGISRGDRSVTEQHTGLECDGFPGALYCLDQCGFDDDSCAHLTSMSF